MKDLARRLSLFLLGLALGMATFSATARAQVFDTHAPYVTIVTKLTSNLPGAKPGSQKTHPVTTANFSGSPYIVGPTVTPTTTPFEAEEHIAVDPNNSNNLVAAISDFSQPSGLNVTKYAVSTDNGVTWKEHFVPVVGNCGISCNPTTGDSEVWAANSDPVVAIDRLGNVYLADLYIINASGTGEGFYVCIASLPNVAFTVSNCVPVATNVAGTNIEDKEWIAVDNSSSPFSGNVYVSWTRFTGCVSVVDCFGTDMILFSRSTDHGQHWSTPIQISPAVQNGAVQGSQVAVGPDGTVYVAYEVFFAGSQVEHFITKSTDGGQTFTPVQAINAIFNDVTFTSDYRKNSFPNLVVSPVANQAFIYDVYPDQPLGNSMIEVVRSITPGSFTFTAPVAINDTVIGQHFMPAATADSSGTLHVSWFDTRNSPANNDLYDIFASFTRNSGNTFAPNARVTPILADGSMSGFIGDYAGIAAAAKFAHPVWNNGGFSNEFLQTATLKLP